ncbi:MAG: radical SAM protein, partial [Oscillospiraceae bacterium]|nr:radical SAM protein [Oscillospiraceae bacterium]
MKDVADIEDITDIKDILRHCTLCPRECGADRLAGQKGFCGVSGEEILLSRAALHFWEEPCISGQEGSGTVFFSGCTLKCIFCQNREISRGQAGKLISTDRLSEIFLELQAKGARNINLVTPTHYLPQIIRALDTAKANGLTLPVVYNTSGYEKVEMLRLLEGYVDIWLPDMKYLTPSIAKDYSSAENYPEHILPALDEMVRQTGEPVFDENGMMKKGVIVRHLALPAQGNDSRKILRTLIERYGSRIWISIMSQYTPPPFELSFPNLNRKLTEREYDRLVDFADRNGIRNAFIQEGTAAEESFIPP